MIGLFSSSCILLFCALGCAWLRIAKKQHCVLVEMRCECYDCCYPYSEALYSIKDVPFRYYLISRIQHLGGLYRK